MVAAFIIVGLATVAGVTSFDGPTQRPSIAPPSPAQVVPANTTAADPVRNTAPIGPRTAAYLDALKRESVPVEDIPTLLLVAEHVCSQRGDTTVAAQADRLMAAFPDRWRPQQAAIIVDCAIKLACG